MIGIVVKSTIGVGDTVQFSSLPENYYLEKGEKLVDLSKSWIFDHNPYVVRDVDPKEITQTVELWNYPRKWPWPEPRPFVYLSNAEILASAFKVPTRLIRPRLYKHEHFPFFKRKKIVLHAHGKSHGRLPPDVITHILEKYGPTGELVEVGPKDLTGKLGIPALKTPTLWDLVYTISDAAMFIGVDSGPSWIAACFPDIVIKKVRTKPTPHALKEWVPLEIKNFHSHWDDRIFQIFNVTGEDIGFTQSYKKL